MSTSANVWHAVLVHSCVVDTWWGRVMLVVSPDIDPTTRGEMPLEHQVEIEARDNAGLCLESSCVVVHGTLADCKGLAESQATVVVSEFNAKFSEELKTNGNN